ncbi:hypothetical protein OFQ49_02405 [Brachyspira hyodysenteriae]|nr:hypothetical protein [Brachyspira hyodysenteriae]MCZ9938143.1 hypothetical protein [Brachyspira hyodysenteriae]
MDGLKCKVTSGSYYHFEDDKLDTIEFTPESINYLREWFDEIVDDIRYDRAFDKKLEGIASFVISSNYVRVKKIMLKIWFFLQMNYLWLI